MEKTSKLPYISLESAEIYNNLEMANGTKDRIPQIFTATIDLGSDLVMFGSMFVLLSQLSPWLAVAVVAITLPYILLDQHIIKQSWELTDLTKPIQVSMIKLAWTSSGIKRRDSACSIPTRSVVRECQYTFKCKHNIVNKPLQR